MEEKILITVELSEEQKDTANLLKELLGQIMADRYKDICRLSSGAFEIRVSEPIAAHAIREFESSLRDILEVPMGAIIEENSDDIARIAKALEDLKQAGFSKDTLQNVAKALRPKHNHKNQIHKIVARLGLDADGDIANAWIGLGIAVKKAHKRSFREALIVDDKFRTDLFQPFQTVIRGVAIALQKQYTSLLQRVSKIVAMSDKGHAIELYAKEIPGALSLQWYFFKNLQSSDWLPYLIKHKGNLLGAPISAIFKEDKETGRYMAEWPAGEYLLRMARQPEAETRKLVIDALNAVSDSNHSDIRRMSMEILEALPPEEAGPHADLAVKWLTYDVNNLYIHKAVNLVIALAKGGQKEAALKVARALLRIWNNDGNVASLFSQHMYEHHLPEIRKAITECDDEESLNLFMDLLEQATAIGSWGEYVYYLKQPLTGQQLSFEGIHGALVLTVAATAKEIVEKDAKRMENIVSRISAKTPKIFTRIAMHILAQNPAAAPNQAEKYLTDPSLIGENWCELEYSALANKWFPLLSSSAQTGILNIIQTIPGEYKESWKERFERHNGHPPTQEDQRKYDDSCIRDLVWNWREVLPQTLQDRLTLIESELGDPDAWRERLAPEISPLEAKDFASRPVADIAAFLKTWRPSENAQRQTVTALAQALRTAVGLAPTKFAESVDQLVGCAPIYLRRALEGLYDAVGKQEIFPWDKTLKVIDHVLEQVKVSTKSDLEAEGDDKNWQWVCIAVGELLSKALGRGVGCINYKHATEIRALILKFHSSVPTVPEQDDFEERYAREPYFTAQFTLRGMSVELCLLTIFWLSKDIASSIGTEPRSAIKNLPDLRWLMKNELDDKSNTGRIPRVIFGRYLTWLNYFGEAWVISEIENLLPPDNEMLCEATWQGHLGHDSGPISSLMQQLHSCYMKEIAGLGVKYDDRQKRLENQLGQFMISLYLGNHLPEDMLNSFWEKAPERLLQHCIWILGQWLKNPPDQMPEEMRARGYAYWSSRLAAAVSAENPAAFRKEIGAFGQWCIGTNDIAWLIEQLCEMLAAGFGPNYPYGIVGWLAEVCSDFPDKAVESLSGLISNQDGNQWDYLLNEGSISMILTRGFTEGTAETKKRVEQVISILASKGETKYIDILDIAQHEPAQGS